MIIHSQITVNGPVKPPHSEAAGSLSGSLTFSPVVRLENFFSPHNAQLDISSAVKPSLISPAEAGFPADRSALWR